jgi:hypothetical protein
MLYFEYLLLNWLFKFPTDYVSKVKKISKKHEDYKINRLFMVALYIPGGRPNEPVGQSRFWEYFNKALKYLAKDNKIIISEEIISSFKLQNTKFKYLDGYVYSSLKIDPITLSKTTIDVNRALDSSFLMFTKGENSDLNMNNRNLK